MAHRLEQGIPVYLNAKTQAVSWVKPADFGGSSDQKLLGIRSFEDLVTSVIKDECIEPLIIKLQAYIRGYLVRERIALRLHHFHSNVAAVVKIQVSFSVKLQANISKAKNLFTVLVAQSGPAAAVSPVASDESAGGTAEATGTVEAP